jgi:hypothetical protein
MHNRFVPAMIILFCSFTSPLPTCAAPTASDARTRQPSEEVKDQSGDTFMQEIPSDNSARDKMPKPKILPDLSRINVPVDPNGQIVPLKNSETGPVLPFYSRIEQTVEPLYQPLPVWNYPYGGMPIYGMYPYAGGGFGTASSIGIGLGGGAFRFRVGSPARPYYTAPYGIAPASPWFVPPGMMPNVGSPLPYVYPPAYPMF